MEGKTEISKIEKAKYEALGSEQLNSIKDEIDVITADFLNSRIDLAEYRKVEELELYPGAIEFETAVEFEAALREIGYDDEFVQECLEHEGEHFKAIEEMGLKGLYRIEFLRNSDGTFGIYPAVSFKFPANIDEENARKILRNVIGAASDLSDRDKGQLGLME